MNIDLLYGTEVVKKKVSQVKINQEVPLTIKISKDMVPELRVIAYALGEKEWIVDTRGFYISGMSYPLGLPIRELCDQLWRVTAVGFPAYLKITIFESRKTSVN